MNRRQRLLAALQGKAVDRPPVSFYEITGFEPRNGDDPYNIFSHPSWREVLDMARDRTDVILMRGLKWKGQADPLAELTTYTRNTDSNGSLHITMTISHAGRTFTRKTRRDPDVGTTWVIEPLLKNADDLRAWLDLPAAPHAGEPDTERILADEEALGDAGVVMLDTGDPLCSVAELFSMADFLMIAMSETDLVHQALERVSMQLLPRAAAFAKALPGRLWRIYGPEYAAAPFLSPSLFGEYVNRYDKPIIDEIGRWGGYARIHCHGRLSAVLDLIRKTGCVGLDPVEPPPQGDMELAQVRSAVGQDVVLFGNLEASDLENLSTDQFARKIERALDEGPNKDGSRFVLMPSACPYGRVLNPLTVRNYRKMLELVGA